MRSATLLYPLANVLHILALMGFAAAVAIMDLRLLGVFRQVPVAVMIRAMRPAALVAFATQAVTGVLLLAPDAGAIAANPAFRLKMLLLSVALINVVVLEVGLRRAPPGAGEAPPVSWRVAAVVSLASWLGVAAAGRLIAYV